jgi:hypothetical protein
MGHRQRATEETRRARPWLSSPSSARIEVQARGRAALHFPGPEKGEQQEQSGSFYTHVIEEREKRFPATMAMLLRRMRAPALLATYTLAVSAFSTTRVMAFEKGKSEDEWRAVLSPAQFRVSPVVASLSLFSSRIAAEAHAERYDRS